MKMDTNQIISFLGDSIFLLVLFTNRSLSTVNQLLRFDVKMDIEQIISFRDVGIPCVFT